MTFTASYASNVDRGETSASVSPSSSHLPVFVLGPGRGGKLPFATPPIDLRQAGHTVAGHGSWGNAFSYVSHGHFLQVYSDFARIIALLDRATDLNLPNALDDLIIETVAAEATSAMTWTERIYSLEQTPDSSIPILAVDDFED